MKSFFVQTIYHPLKKHVVLTLCIIGVCLLLAGVTVAADFWSRLFMSVGTAILGGGVFGAIVKSAQFADIFQKHIFNVFYHPSELESELSIRAKWQVLTHSLVKKALNDDYKEATAAIESAFLDEDFEYHLESHEMKYSIEDLDGSIVKITNHSSVYIIPTEGAVNPIFKRRLQDSTGVTYDYVAINGQQVEQDAIEAHLAPSEDAEFQTQFEVKLSQNGAPPTRTKLEITTSWEQDVEKDPILKGRISRYVKGLCVKIKKPDTMDVHLEPLGLDIPSCSFDDSVDGEGFFRCTISPDGALLLPGQGYIVVIRKLKE